jgi:hypothetical protein
VIRPVVHVGDAGVVVAAHAPLPGSELPPAVSSIEFVD